MPRHVVGIRVLVFAATLCTHASSAPRGSWTPAPQPYIEQVINASPELRLTNVLPGPQSVWMIGPLKAPNPDGKTWDILLFFSPNYTGPHEVAICDLGAGEVHRQNIDKVGDERFIFHIIATIWTGKKLCILPRTTSKKLAVVSYDPVTNQLRYHGYPMGEQVRGPGGEHVPHWRLGNDGMIYGPATVGNRVVGYRLNPDTFDAEVSEPFGRQRSRSWNYNRSVIEDEWLYFEVGKKPWELFAYNTKTKQGKLLAETEPIAGGPETINLKPLKDLGGYTVTIDRLKGGGDGKTEFWLKDGELTEKSGDAPPWSGQTPTNHPTRPTITAKWPEILVDRPDFEGQVRVRYWDPGPESTEAPSPHDDSGWSEITFGVNRYPQPIRRLTTLLDDRLFATTEGYGQAVLLDPLRRKREPLGDTSSIYSQGEVNGLIYMGAYPSSQFWVYDPNQPWTARTTERVFANCDRRDVEPVPGQPGNPRLLTQLRKYTHPNLHEPLGQICKGMNGKLYTGGKTIRLGSGGGLAWWDPKTESAGGLREPFTAYEVHWMAATDEGRYILCSTKPEEDQEHPGFHPDKAKIFVFDCKAQEIIHEIEAPPEMGLLGPIAEAFPGHAIGFGDTRGSNRRFGVLYGIDVAEGKIVWTKLMPAPPTLDEPDVRRARSFLQRGPDGCLWSIANRVLMRIRPSDAAVQVIGKISNSDFGQLAFSRGELYVAGSEYLRRIELPPIVKRDLKKRR